MNRYTYVSAWGVVGLIVIAAFIENWQPMEKNLKATGSKLAVTYMRDSVKRIQQQWLMQGEPNEIVFESQSLKVNEFGMLIIDDEFGNPNCEYWLQIHYPQRTIMRSELLKFGFIPNGVGYNCYYQYSSGETIVVRLSERLTSLSVQQ